MNLRSFVLSLALATTAAPLVGQIDPGPPGYRCVVLDARAVGFDGHIAPAVSAELYEGAELAVDTKTCQTIGAERLNNYADLAEPEVLLSGVGMFKVVTRSGSYSLRIDTFTNRDESIFMYYRPFNTVLTGLCTWL